MHNKSKKRDAKNSIEFFHILFFVVLFCPDTYRKSMAVRTVYVWYGYDEQLRLSELKEGDSIITYA